MGGGGLKGASLIFPKSWSDMIGLALFVMHVCISSLQVSQKDLVSLKELRNLIPLAGLGMLQ